MTFQAIWLGAMGDFSAPSTARKRTTVWRHWLAFHKLSDGDFDLIRPTILYVCLWIVYLFNKKLAFNSVRSYLYSWVTEIKLRGGNDFIKLSDAWFIHSTMKHYQRTLGAGPIQYRRPLTADCLVTLIRHTDLTDYNSRVMMAMLIMGVFCMLRVGSMLCQWGRSREIY